ncbi:fimbrial protein [Serratia sp. NA_112.1]|uniref:fimbrial protein n=1 Tax=unclassified Serratia (in: enterobacteria) TaxID=2647522 RepID=UPI004046F347
MRKLTLTLCALAAVSTSVLAADEVTQGTVTFNGELTAETCSIENGSQNRIVTLPKVAIQTLNANGKEAGSKMFQLTAENCPKGLTQVAAHFEAIGSSGLDGATGNLKNEYQGAETKATEVQVRLYNTDGTTQLKLGDTGTAAKVDDKGSATMTYYGGYYATAATGAGMVYAQARYTLAYP